MIWMSYLVMAFGAFCMIVFIVVGLMSVMLLFQQLKVMWWTR